MLGEQRVHVLTHAVADVVAAVSNHLQARPKCRALRLRQGGNGLQRLLEHSHQRRQVGFVVEADIAAMEEFGNQVGLEDQALVESIQRAARSGGLSEGRLLLESEHLIQHFQRLVERALR